MVLAVAHVRRAARQLSAFFLNRDLLVTTAD